MKLQMTELFCPRATVCRKSYYCSLHFIIQLEIIISNFYRCLNVNKNNKYERSVKNKTRLIKRLVSVFIYF